LEVSPLNILNKKCYITGAIKIESIFLGDNVTLQIKLYEAIVRVIKQGKRLLSNDYRKKKPSLAPVPVAPVSEQPEEEVEELDAEVETEA
jgi:hypothetical protein